MTTEDKIIEELEHLAGIFYKILLNLGIVDGHAKHYDPLTIEKVDNGYMLHSYVFDYEDGGRHRLKPTLEAAEEWLIKSFESYFSEQLSSLEQRKDQELSQYKQQLVEEIHAEIKQGVIDFPCDFAYNDGLTKAKSIITKGDL